MDALDIPDVKARVSPQEWALRVDLAAAYRLVARFGWSDLVFTHISARLPDEQFLINPYGLGFDEITASSLLKIDAGCNKLLESPFPVNPAGFTIHGCIHAARPDVGCVLHTHTRCGVAVSAQRRGLLPISQQATLVLPQLGYHDYEGIALRADEQPRLQRDLGKHNALVLRNHGLLTVGASVADAFVLMYLLESACQIQIAAQGVELIEVGADILQGAAAAARAVTAGQGAGIAWPALLRSLERTDPGYAR